MRADQARQIGEAVAEERLALLAAHVDAGAGAILAVNTVPRARVAVVEATIDGSGPLVFVTPNGGAVAAQVVDEGEGVELRVTGRGDRAGLIADLVGPARIAGYHVSAMEGAERDGAVAITATAAAPPTSSAFAQNTSPERGLLRESESAAVVAGARARPERAIAAGAATEVTLTVRRPWRRVVAAVPLRATGWTALHPAPHPADQNEGGSDAGTAEVRRSIGAGPASERPHGVTISTHLVDVTATADGTLEMHTAEGIHLSGLNRLVDDADDGDLYDWSPGGRATVSAPRSVDVRVSERGPVRAALRVTAEYDLPGALGPLTVATDVALVTGEPFVRLTATIDNPAGDHRLRALFPLPAPVRSSVADTAFGAVELPLAAEGNPLEAALSTHPSLRWVDCAGNGAGLAVVHDAAGEHEVLDGGRTLAFTLLRATGLLSRSGGAIRPDNAAPSIRTPEAQLVGRTVRRYAIFPHRGAWHDADLEAIADALLLPAEVALVGESDRTLAAEGERLAVEGAAVTAVTREPQLTVRVVRLSPAPVVCAVTLDGRPATGWVVDLRGHPQSQFAGSVPLRPFEIATLRLDQ